MTLLALIDDGATGVVYIGQNGTDELGLTLSIQTADADDFATVGAEIDVVELG